MDQLLVLPPSSDPMAVARRYVEDRFIQQGTHTLRAWRGGFQAFTGRYWREIEEASVRADLYRYLETGWLETDQGPVSWQPTRAKVANVVDALKAVVHLDASVQPPTWLDGSGQDPRQMIVVANGVLHVPTRELRPHHAKLFIGHAVPFSYEPDAREAPRWANFLRELWAGDDSSIALLQEMFGYALAADTSLQKILLLVGPPRAGKGVIATLLTRLLGRESVGAPTLAGLTTNFGLQDLIGKTLAIVSDARLGPRANVSALVERLLSISGGDAITIDRKYRDPWTGPLGVRFMLLTNELPRFVDASGALAKRFMVLVLTRSFYGRENPRLAAQLVPELPAILNWALDGLDRLNDRGYFTQPESSRGAIQDLEDLASPIAAFLRERCVIGREQQVTLDRLWAEWLAWCDEQSHFHGSRGTFGRDLHAAIAGLRVARPRENDRQRLYVGVGLARDSENNGEDRGPPGPPGPAVASRARAAGSDGRVCTRSAAPGATGDSIVCADYRAHQLSHRYEHGVWICDVCTVEE
jgi:putative DNA primase/helicase